ELTKRLREGGWSVVVVAGLDAALLRALEHARPDLLVLTGAAKAEAWTRASEASSRALGPHARLGVSPDAYHLLAAVDAAECLGLERAFGPARLRLAPTPAWLPEWLDDPLLEEDEVVGTVHALRCDRRWRDWIRARAPERRDVIVPVGVPELDLDEVLDPERRDLELVARATAAHALE